MLTEAIAARQVRRSPETIQATIDAHRQVLNYLVRLAVDHDALTIRPIYVIHGVMRLEPRELVIPDNLRQAIVDERLAIERLSYELYDAVQEIRDRRDRGFRLAR